MIVFFRNFFVRSKKRLELVWSFLSARQKLQILVLVFVSIIIGIIEVVGIGSLFGFLNVVTDPGVFHENSKYQEMAKLLNISDESQFIFAFGIFTAGFTFFRAIAIVFELWFRQRTLANINKSVALQLYENYLHQKIERFQEDNTAVLVKNVVSESAGVSMFVGLLAGIVLNLVIVGIIFCALLLVEGGVTLYVFGGLIVVYSVAFVVMRPLMVSIAQTKVKLNTYRFKELLEGLEHVREIKFFEKERYFAKIYGKTLNKFYANEIFSKWITTIPRHVIEVSAFCALIGCILFAISANLDLASTISTIVIFVLAFFRMMPRFDAINQNFLKLKFASASIDVVADDLLFRSNELKSKDIDICEFKDKIEFKHVDYQYPTNSKATQKILISALRGTRVAFVGSSGAGKTTLLDLLVGFLTPTAGSYSIDGKLISAKNVKSARAIMAYAPQHVGILNSSVSENIAIGESTHRIDNQKVITASKAVNLHEFVEKRLPNGYSSLIGQKGANLSGGYIQRLGLARALYRSPQILIMDEATSALDKVSEREILNSIKHFYPSITVITVTHRIETLHSSDVIYVIENGRIVGWGDYDKLSKTSDVFKSFS